MVSPLRTRVGSEGGLGKGFKAPRCAHLLPSPASLAQVLPRGACSCSSDSPKEWDACRELEACDHLGLGPELDTGATQRPRHLHLFLVEMSETAPGGLFWPIYPLIFDP